MAIKMMPFVAVIVSIMLIASEANMVRASRGAEGQSKLFLHKLGGVGRKIYYLEFPSNIQYPMDWEAAANYCQQFHLRLASIRSERERGFLNYLSSSSPIHPDSGFWITTPTGAENPQLPGLCPLAHFLPSGIAVIWLDCSVGDQGALCEEIS